MKGTTNLSQVVLVTMVLLAISGSAFATGDQEAATAPGLEEIGFRETGYPVVDTPVTMEAVIQYTGPPHRPVPFAELTLLNALQEKTNVWIDWEEIPSTGAAERISLMYAARDFPDVMFSSPGITDSLVYTAGQGGDLYALNEYIEQYAPNWRRSFDARPTVEQSVTFPDGNIYSLPYARDFAADYKIRDMHLINTDWLEKVDEEMPTTLDEFRDVLRAFRAGIDDGTLPANGYPWYLQFRSYIGGEFELYGAFGIWAYDEDFLSVNDGTVEYAGTDPRMIDAIEFLHGLYQERLIMEEAFTDSWDDYTTKARTSVPPIVGSFSTFGMAAPIRPYFEALPVLPATGVTEPLYRSQPIRVQKHQFQLFTGFPYPEVAVRFIDEMADPETALQMSYGRIGHEILEENGTYRVVGDAEEWNYHSPHNFIASFIPARITDNVVWEEPVLAMRTRVVDELYGPHIWPQERHFPGVSYTEDELEELSILQTEIREYVNTTHADWIVNGGAREGWERYLRELEGLGLPRLMEIYQAALDRFYGN